VYKIVANGIKISNQIVDAVKNNRKNLSKNKILTSEIFLLFTYLLVLIMRFKFTLCQSFIIYRFYSDNGGLS